MVLGSMVSLKWGPGVQRTELRPVIGVRHNQTGVVVAQLLQRHLERLRANEL